MISLFLQQEVSPRTSGRLSHSSGPLNGNQSCGSLTDSPPVSPSEIDDVKVFFLSISGDSRTHGHRNLVTQTNKHTRVDRQASRTCFASFSSFWLQSMNMVSLFWGDKTDHPQSEHSPGFLCNQRPLITPGERCFALFNAKVNGSIGI